MNVQARFAVSAAVLVLLAACSGVPLREREQQALDQYLEYAGPAVDHFSYLGR